MRSPLRDEPKTSSALLPYEPLVAEPTLGLLMRLKFALLKNRVGQVINRSPLKLLLVVFFVAMIWAALFLLFDSGFRFMRRFQQAEIIAIPYVFHIFFVAMTALLAFSTAVLVYGGLFGRAEPAFLMASPNKPRNIVAIMYIEALFFASWSLLLLGVPLMLAYGEVQGLSWYFYLIFVGAFLGFVPIPGAMGLVVAFAVALYLPKQARRVLFYGCVAIIGLIVLYWGRLWVASSSSSTEWVTNFVAELQYLKAALLPSTWVSNAIRFAVENRTKDALFYLAVTASTGFFFSWAAINFAGTKLLRAFGRAHAVTSKTRAYSGYLSRFLTAVAFFYAPQKMRTLILKDVRTFLRDPLQWSQLAILFGLLALYLAYLPRSRPEGFTTHWKALICFLNYGAVTLILSTFTSRFVFPMISLEGRQIWLVALWPLQRADVLWAKLLYAGTVTAGAAMLVTYLSIRALELPWQLGMIQGFSTLTTCLGLCGLAIGLGARMPSYEEPNAGRIASGLGGTINLVASVAFVAVSVCLFGWICYRLVGRGRLDMVNGVDVAIFAALLSLGLAMTLFSMRMGIRHFTRQQF